VRVLVICRPRVDVDEAAIVGHISEEAAALEEWRCQGILEQAYSPGVPGAILILEVSGASEAETLTAGLPLCQAGLIQTEVIALHPLQY
jgi:hypothetical protein